MYMFGPCQLGCRGSSVGKSIYLECRVSWIQIPPDATHFSFFHCLRCLSFFLSFFHLKSSYIHTYTYIHLGPVPPLVTFSCDLYSPIVYWEKAATDPYPSMTGSHFQFFCQSSTGTTLYSVSIVMWHLMMSLYVSCYDVSIHHVHVIWWCQHTSHVCHMMSIYIYMCHVMMYIYMYMYMWWCQYTCTCTCDGVNIHVHVHVMMSIYMYMYIWWCQYTCTYDDVNIHVHVQVIMSIYMYMYMWWCQYTCILSSFYRIGTIHQLVEVP